MTINFGLMPSIGAGLFEGFGISFDTGDLGQAAFELMLDNMVRQLAIQGMDASWKMRRNLFRSGSTYEIIVQGQGWQRLSNLTDVNQALNNVTEVDTPPISSTYKIVVTETNDGNIHFSMSIPEDMVGFYYVFSYEYNLHGGKILSSNADKVSGGTATWINPAGHLQATLTAKSAASTLGRVLTGTIVIGGVGSIIFIIIRWITNKKPKVETGYEFFDSGGDNFFT